MVSSNNGINNTVGASISGVTNTFTVTNGSNTASSAARSTITVGGGSAADPTLNFNISGVTDFEIGIDNNDSDKLKISQGTALGTNDTWIMTTAGERTMPLQPAFLAYLPSNDNNVTGDSTNYFVGQGTALTIVFDQGGDVSTAGVFTAPVTGRYKLENSLDFSPVTASHTQGNYFIVTSNRTYFPVTYNPTNCFNPGGGVGFNGMVLADMDAGDTATFGGVIGGGAKTIGARGGASPRVYICGHLVC